MNRTPYSLPVDLTCDPALIGNGVSMELVKKYIKLHQSMQRRYQYLERMYCGFHDVFRQPEKESWKPDNRLAVNYPRYMTETFLGYAYGIPIKETHPDDSVADAMKAFQDNNEITDHEFELFQNVCIYGHAFEVLYQDEEAQTRMIACTPQEVFVVYDDTVKRRALFAVRYNYRITEHRQICYGQIMNRESIADFDDGKIIKNSLNPYGKIPVVEYLMNRQRIGLYEQACGLIEIYNCAVSEKANDVDAFAEAYLKIIGADLSADDVKNMRDNRVINITGEGDDPAAVIAEFLTKPAADATQENLLNRLDQQIYQVSMVANISDESFGNATSGTALAYKMQAMSNLALGFDRKIEKSLRKRYKLWATLKTNVPDPNCWRELQITTSRNLPKNRLEEAQTAAQLTGLVSQETLLSLLSFVPDPKLEMEKIEAEQDEALIDFDSHEEPNGEQ